MKRVVRSLVLVAALTTLSGAVARGQQSARPGDPGILRRNFSPVAYLKASNPRADAKLRIWQRSTRAHAGVSRDGARSPLQPPMRGSGATGINGNQKDDSASNAGAIYVFTRSGGKWAQQAYVKASNTAAYDSFGFTLSLSGDGNTLAVGATREDSAAHGINGSGADNSAEDSGAVYVCPPATGGQWTQRA